MLRQGLGLCKGFWANRCLLLNGLKIGNGLPAKYCRIRDYPLLGILFRLARNATVGTSGEPISTLAQGCNMCLSLDRPTV